jgi:cytochrome c biogenesis protein
MKSERIEGEETTGRDAPSAAALGIVDRILRWLSSLQVGIVLMLILIGAAIIGTLIPQQNAEGFDQFYARLTPAERALYGHLGLFDVYRSWWFTTAVLLLVVNLVLCSIDRLPMTLRYVREPKTSATPLFARAQPLYASLSTTRGSAEVVELLTRLFARRGWRPRAASDAPFPTVFGERGVWSRWNFFFVHGSILVIVGAAFVSARWGYEGTIVLSPGTQTQSLSLSGSRGRGIPERSAPLPFTVRCEGLRVALKDPRGPLVPQNVINWYTEIVIADGGAERRATVAVNKPFDYRGYRFFQSGAGRPGDASRITLAVRPERGIERVFSLAKNRAATVPDLGEIRFIGFTGNFRRSSSSRPDDYEDPAALIEITTSSGGRRTLWVFPETSRQPETAEERATASEDPIPGYRFVLRDFDKASVEHVLQVRYDPGVGPLYVGFVGLTLSLLITLFSAHQRIWAVVEPEDSHLTLHLAAHASRNEDRLKERFQALVGEVSEALGERPPTQ